MKLFASLSIFLAFLVCTFTVAARETAECRVVSINNQAASAVALGGVTGRVLKVAAGIQRTTHMNIPFVSCTDPRYYKNFVNDRPYVPDEALRIVIVATGAEWAIWRNERGVVCARLYEPGITSEEECGERLLHDPTRALECMAVASYLLKITEGNIIKLDLV